MTATEHETALPRLPSGTAAPEANAQHAQRARERDRRLPSAAVVGGVLSGAGVLDRPPPSILGVWARHHASAAYYHAPLFRWPRYVYGAWHAFVEVPVLYFLAWSGDSVPKRLAVYAVAATLIWLIWFQ